MNFPLIVLLIACFTSANIFATPEDDLAAQTGGMSFHLNKQDFVKQVNANPKAFADAIVKQTISTGGMKTIQIPLTELPSTNENFKQFTFQVKSIMNAFNVMVQSAENIGMFNIINPEGQIIKPDFVDTRANNGKIDTRLFVQNPAAGIWKINIDNSRPFTISATYTTQSNRAVIWQAYNIPPLANGRIEFPVDPSLTNLSVVVTAKSKMPVIQLLGPDKKPAAATDTSITATTFKSVDKPIPGVWTVLIASEEEFSVQIVGQSVSFIVSQDFQHKVLGHEGMMYIPDHTPLLAGSQRVFALDLISNQNMGLRNLKILLVDVAGDIISITDVPNISRMNDWLEIKNLTLPIPNENFRVMITGKDSAGFTYQRMGNYLYPVTK